MRKYVGLFALVATLAAVGCRKSEEPIREGASGEQGPPPGWQEVPPAEEPIEETGPLADVPEARTLEEALPALQAAAERVRAGEDADQAALVSGIEALADAVAGLPEVTDGETLRGNLRAYADRIRTSDPASMDHARWAKDAFGEAARALRKVGDQREIEGYADRMAQLDTQIEALAADRPLLEQRVAVAATFDQLAEALTLLGPSGRGTQ